MPKKPIPMPVADRPGFPSLADATERALERQKTGPGEYPAYIACPNDGSELLVTTQALRPTAPDGSQCLRCPDCGWTGSIPTGTGY